MHVKENIERRDPGAAVMLIIVGGLMGMTVASAVLTPAQTELSPNVGYRIDVNTAEVGELQLLPNVGPAISGAIIADRESWGLFTRVEDMERVKGIGPTLVERFREYVRFSKAQPRDD